MFGKERSDGFVMIYISLVPAMVGSAVLVKGVWKFIVSLMDCIYP